MKPVLCLIFFVIAGGAYSQLLSTNDPPGNVNGLAIEPQRTISFSTNEGSNMHIDISPDGSKILFTLLGDIYCIPAAGGIATQLTRGMAINDYPVWSPDGKRIAYTSDVSGVNAIHVMNAEGKESRLIARTDPPFNIKFGDSKWSADGLSILARNKIYYLAGGSCEVEDSLTEVMGFSKDGQYFYSLNYVENGWKVVRYGKFPFGEAAELVSRSCDGHCELINPRISPDGHWLTYIKGVQFKTMDSLMICDLTNGTERLLTRLNIKYAGYLGLQHYSFSSDSHDLFIGYGGKIHKINTVTGKNEIIPFTANVNVDMGPLRYHTFNVPNDSFSVKYIRSAHSSPDGKQLVFSALNRIYIKELPGGVPRLLYDQSFGQFHPEWSPDGKWIAYVSWSDTIGGHIWRIRANGGKPQRITRASGLYMSPSWSPDGKLIVATKGLRNEYTCDEGQIVYINVESQEMHTVAENIPLPNLPKFSADGYQILYRPGRLNADDVFFAKLVSVNISGKLMKVIVKGKQERGTLRQQIQLSPDGRYIVFSRNENIFLAPVLNYGQPVTIFDPTSRLPVIRLTLNGIDPHWEDSGKTLSWSFADQYFQVGSDKIIKAAMEAVQNNKEVSTLVESETVDIDIVPDKIISIGLKSPGSHAKGTIAFKNARIITMNGNQVIEDGCIIVANGRFTAVGDVGTVKIPKGIPMLDMKGKTIMPGLIDMHHHMGRPSEIIPGQYWKYLVMLAYGVTTARDPSGSHEKFAYGELTASGQMRGPRMYHVGNAVRSDYYFVSPLEARLIADNRAKMNGTVIKHYVQPTRIQQQWLLMAADKVGLNMTNEGSYYYLDEIAMLKDGCAGVEHNPNWGETYADIITLFARSGTYLTPALQTSYSRAFEEHPKYYFRQKYLTIPEEKYMRFTHDDYIGYLRASIVESAKRIDTTAPNFLPESKIDAAIIKAGGHVLMGSHGEDQGIGAHFELWALQMGGLSNMEALRAATISGAEGLGVQQDVGSIQEGKIADMLILDKNPLDDIHNSKSIVYVVKDGVLYDGNTLNIVWPFKQKMPEWIIGGASK